MNLPTDRRIRRASRVLLLDPAGRTLLFRFTPQGKPPFWTAPGGECDPDESFDAAARRELLEETGISADPQPLGTVMHYDFTTLGDEPVTAEEHYYHCRTELTAIDTSGHTELERATMLEHRWFTATDIDQCPEAIYPADINAMIAALLEKSA
jgi:8-oxo-dGTP pyrophosphatase MutT (NUDIX family)